MNEHVQKTDINARLPSLSEIYADSESFPQGYPHFNPDEMKQILQFPYCLSAVVLCSWLHQVLHKNESHDLKNSNYPKICYIYCR